jgi:hypothetical protein
VYSKTIIDISKPTTQSIDSVKALLAWKGHPTNPLPCDVSLENGRLVLVLSNKKDCFYVVTARECSCPSATYRHNGPCKHQRKYFPEAKAATKPTASILPERKPFKPFLEDEVKSASSFELVDTLADPSPRDLAYHSIQEDKALWPCEA